MSRRILVYGGGIQAPRRLWGLLSAAHAKAPISAVVVDGSASVVATAAEAWASTAEVPIEQYQEGEPLAGAFGYPGGVDLSAPLRAAGVVVMLPLAARVVPPLRATCAACSHLHGSGGYCRGCEQGIGCDGVCGECRELEDLPAHQGV